MAGVVLPMEPAIGDASMLPLSWIVLAGLQSAFFLGFTMGANDVANAFGSSVGAGVFGITEACVIASIFDVAGSLTLGAGVSSTVATKIIDVQIYRDEPGLFMLGMMSASIGAMLCVGGATRMGLPISTTHAVIGAVAGFSFVETTDGIIWLDGKNGLAAIMLSWVVSPLFSGCFGAIIYTVVKRVCLDLPDLDHALRIQRKLAAAICGWVAALVIVFVLYDLTESGTHYDWANLVISIVVALVVAGTCYLWLLPWMERKFSNPILSLSHPGDPGDLEKLTPSKQAISGDDTAVPCMTHPRTAHPLPLRVNRSYGTHVATTDGVGTAAVAVATGGRAALVLDPPEDGAARKMSHRTGLVPRRNDDEAAAGTQYDPELERRFMPLCVMTACFMAFTHGANDIANAAGPLVAIWDVYTHGTVDAQADINYWILVVCCCGVVVGLMAWGGFVIRTVGTKITAMTPSKAVSIQLGTSTAVLIASFLKMPVSSTHCFIGAVVAVGLLNGEGAKAIQWSMVRKIVASWIITVPLAGLISAAVYAGLKGTTTGTLTPPGYTLAFYNGTFDGGNSTEL